jgi:hypothetical protein
MSVPLLQRMVVIFAMSAGPAGNHSLAFFWIGRLCVGVGDFLQQRLHSGVDVFLLSSSRRPIRLAVAATCPTCSVFHLFSHGSQFREE